MLIKAFIADVIVISYLVNARSWVLVNSLLPKVFKLELLLTAFIGHF